MEHWPEIIREAAASPQGMVALLVLLLATITLAFFRLEHVAVRLGVFLLVYAGVAFYAISAFSAGKIEGIQDGKAQARLEILHGPEGDCDARTISLKDRLESQVFDIEVFNNCRYVDWTTADSTITTLARSTGLSREASQWALMSYAPGYHENGCDRREFVLYDKSRKQFRSVAIADNCKKIDFGQLPWRIAERVAELANL